MLKYLSFGLFQVGCALCLSVILLACDFGTHDAPAPNPSAAATAPLRALPNLDSLGAAVKAAPTESVAKSQPTIVPHASASPHASAAALSSAKPALSATPNPSAAATANPQATAAVTATPPPSATAAVTAAPSSSAHPPKRPGLLSPSLLGSVSNKSVAPAPSTAHRRTTNAPTRPGVTQ